jgi:dynein heavy chain
VRPALLEDSSFELAPGFSVPPPGGIAEYRSHIDDNMPPESPLLFGLHPNAEINFLTTQSDTLFQVRTRCCIAFVFV